MRPRWRTQSSSVPGQQLHHEVLPAVGERAEAEDVDDVLVRIWLTARASAMNRDTISGSAESLRDNTLMAICLRDQRLHCAIDGAKAALAQLGFDPTYSPTVGMTLRLLCTHADFFASGAPIGALEGCEFEGANAPSEEVDILQVHGHSDAVVSFDAVAIPQRDAILGGFSFGAPSIIEQDAGHTATRWLTPSATVFEFWEHDYETSATVVFVGLDGHCVPGGDDFDGLPAGYSCEDVGTFVFGELAMQFFLAHPKG
jgi:hypothetical protein